jgi:hypothetical protein
LYSIIAAFSSFFYRNKLPSELSVAESKILGGEANIGEKLSIFFVNLIGGFIAPPVWIIAGFITFFIYIINLFL